MQFHIIPRPFHPPVFDCATKNFKNWRVGKPIGTNLHVYCQQRDR